MLLATGNIWDMGFDAICVTTNGIVKPNGRLVMGGGIAKEAVERYPDIDDYYGKLVWLRGNSVWVYRKETDDPAIISFPTKHDWRDPSDLDLIVESTDKLVALADRMHLVKVGLPRPGCGLGGLHWRDVAPILEERLDDRFTVVSFKDEDFEI